MKILLKQLAIWAIVLFLVAGGVYVWTLQHRISLLSRELDQEVLDRATHLGAVEARYTTAATLAKKLSASNAHLLQELQKVRPGVKAVERVDTTATLENIVPQDLVTSKTGDPNIWNDQHHRFTFHLDTKTLARKQEFSLQTVVIQSPGGVRVAHESFTERDPITHEAITDEETPNVTSSYTVVRETQAVPVFHPRAVAGVGYLGQVGLGVEVANGEKFGGVWAHTNLSLLGLYDIREKTLSGAVVVAYRPFAFNLSVGPAFFYPHPAFGAAATIELTR